jgi:hypothetical protein
VLRFRPLLAFALLLLAGPLLAHPEWKEAVAIGVIDEDMVFDLKIRFDVPSYYVGKHPKEATIKELDEVMFVPGRIDAVAANAPAEFLKGIGITADGAKVPVELLGFPTPAEVRELSRKQGEADRYPVLLSARLRAKLPKETSVIAVTFPSALGPVVANFRKGMDSQVLMSLKPGETGDFTIGVADFSLKGFWTEGFGHVIPEGWDHCLFMVAMMLAATSVGEALRRSLIFTLGHAVTLTLVVTGLIPPVGGWIEPVIAATIALGGYLAYRQRPARVAFLVVPLAFGLIHGLGFAAAAADKLQGIHGADLGKLLLGFNLGVETAQAALIVVTAGVLFGLGKLQADPTKARRWLGASIALVGTAIMILRTWALARGA